MKVIASIKYEDRKSRSKKITVRKCPPNYKPQEGEYVVEVEDYTEDDIRDYLHPAVGETEHKDSGGHQGWLKPGHQWQPKEDV